MTEVDYREKVTRLWLLAQEPTREAMTRSEQFPSMAAQHIRNQEEKRELRAGLREALGIIEMLATTVVEIAEEP